jgi:thiol-disulfide isomerase/thioredoxin
MTLKTKFTVTEYLFILIIILVTGCSPDGKKGLKTIIRGSFPELAGKQVTLSEFDVNSAMPVDTSEIDNDGSFSFKFRRQGAGFYLVKVDNKNYVTLILDKEKLVEVYSDQKSIRKNYQVKGSVDSENFRDFEMAMEVNRSKVDSLTKSFSKNQRSPAFHAIKPEMDNKYQAIFNEQRRAAMQFIDNHCNSLASLLILNKRFGERRILTEEKDFTWFIKVDSCLSTLYPENKHLIESKKRLAVLMQNRSIIEKAEKILSPGNTIPDITLQNQAGKNVQLYSLEGRPVILYFWASWDPLSRKANKMIKEIAGQAKDKPAVYAIALETYKEMWEDAIKADGLQEWINVTDFLNVHSSAKTMFNIPDELPYFFLLDKSLIIRYKGSSFDELAAEINR